MKVAIIGQGKTGKHLLEIIPSKDRIGPFDSKNPINTNRALLSQADVAIVFTPFSAVDSFIRELLDFSGIVLWGVTGYDFSAWKDRIEKNGRVWVHSNNFSFGMLSVFSVLRELARLQDLGDEVKFSIKETHHQSKLDAPSGTAKVWEKILLENGASLSREIESFRQGDYVGEHVLEVELPGEKITLTHQGFDRKIYARGAFEFAKILFEMQNKNALKPGYYDQNLLMKLRR